MTIAIEPLALGERLRSAREGKGLRLDDAAYLARQLLPPTMPISRETVRRYEKGDVPEAEANPLYLAALARVYDVPLAELSPAARDSIDNLREVLVSIPCYSAA